MSIDTPRAAHRTDRRPASTGSLNPPSLVALAEATTSEDELYANLLARLECEATIAAAAVYCPSPDGRLSPAQHNYSGPVFSADSFRQQAQEAAVQAFRDGHSEVESSSVRNLRVLARRISVPGREHHILVAGVIVPQGTSAPLLGGCQTVLEAATATASLWHARACQKETENHLRETAVTIDLIRLLETADNARAADIQLVNAVREQLQVTGVALAMNQGHGRCRISARSGLSEADAGAQSTRIMQEAFDECLMRERTSVFPPTDAGNRDALLAHQQLAAHIRALRLITVPLVTSDGEQMGAWMVIDNEATQPESALRRLLELSAEQVADTLRVVRRADSFFARRRPRGSGLRRLIQASLVLAVICAVLLLPVPHKISCHCAAEPDVRRYVVAPHAGLLEKSLVKAGDVVRRGQLLATMDGRDIAWELAGLEAERAAARKQQDTALIDGDIGASQRAALEWQQVEARRHVLQRQRSQLELTSPVDGIVLDGHLERVENAPVTIGQPLFEVAPLSPVTVEVAIADEDYAHVDAGFSVDVTFDGISTTFAGVIDAIRPRSEIRDAENVFIATVILDNPDEQLRPGMKGHARVTGRTRSLGWTLFHKSAEHVQSWLPFL